MKLILDCDPGNSIPMANVDDSLAIALLSRLPALHHGIEIITVFGNAPAPVGYDCAQDLLEVFILDLPLACGEAPGSHIETEKRAEKLHHPAAQERDRKVVDYVSYRDASVVAIGPLTNLARAIDKGFIPREVYVMGGAVGFGDLVDTNFAIDPQAAYRVLNCEIPLTSVPLDTTRTTCLSMSRWDSIYKQLSVQDPALADSVDGWLRPWIEYSEKTRPVAGMWVHGVVALIAFLIDHGLAPSQVLNAEQVRLRVDPQSGKLYLRDDGNVATLVTGVNNDELIVLLEDVLLNRPTSVLALGTSAAAASHSVQPDKVG